MSEPKHRAPQPTQGFFGYFIGRVAAVVLLLLVAIFLFVAGLVLGGWLFVLLIKGYVGN